LVELQDNVDALPLATVAGVAVSETVGTATGGAAVGCGELTVEVAPPPQALRVRAKEAIAGDNERIGFAGLQKRLRPSPVKVYASA
jgi:hypothetical protein